MTREKKNGKWPGISQKEGKSGNYSIISFLKKKNCEVRFCPFFLRKKQNLFLKTYSNLQNLSPKLYFLGAGEGSNLKKA